jgi:hypothetical protein
MSSVVERDIAHIRSLHSADLGSQRRINNESTEYVTDRLALQSKGRCHAVNYGTSMVKEKIMKHERKVIALDSRMSMMLQNDNI